jgi:hypothetical protein
MGYLDDIKTITPQQNAAASVEPKKTTFKKEGYFDWDKHSKDNKAVGVILPPYATWLQERVVAIKSGQPFTTPFYLRHGLHAIGAHTDKAKIYVSCRKSLVDDNKLGGGNGLVLPEVSNGGNSCPICDICWNVVHPECEEILRRNGKDKKTPEYLSAAEARKQVSPQQKFLFNFLPAGSNVPVILDVSKSLGEHIHNMHYDPTQPDLLWPFSNSPRWVSTWISIDRKLITNQPTVYTLSAVYVGQPHVYTPNGEFDQKTYEEIVAKVKDLRLVGKELVPDEETIRKAVIKAEATVARYNIAVNTHAAVKETVAQATEGIGGTSATEPPPIQISLASVEQKPAMQLPPSISSMAKPIEVTNESAKASLELENLLAGLPTTK